MGGAPTDPGSPKDPGAPSGTATTEARRLESLTRAARLGGLLPKGARS